MAQCAACLQPIARGEQFALDGTEVFHRACVRQSYRSKLKVAEQTARDAEARLADTRAAAARVEAEVNTQRNLAMQRQAQVIQLQGELHRARAAAEIQEEYRRAAEGVARDLQAILASTRAELAAERAANRPQPEEKPTEDLDATSLRFKMLELD